MSVSIYDKRKLSNAIRKRLLEFAVERFMEPKLRKAEEKAEKAFIESIKKDALKISKHDRELLARYDVMKEVQYVSLPQFIRIREEDKVIQLGDKEVRRPRFRRVYRPTQVNAMDIRDEAWNSIVSAAGSMRAEDISSEKDNYYGVSSFDHKLGYTRIRYVKMKEKFEAPCGNVYISIEREFDHNIEDGDEPLKTDGDIYPREKAKHWVSKQTLERLKDYFIAADARLAKEFEMHKAMALFLAQADTFGQVTAFWSEAASIGEQLYGPPPVKNALVAISEEQKAALCQNMQARNVKSA